MKRIAVISAILENPKKNQEEFNGIISEFRGSIRGEWVFHLKKVFQL